MRKLTTVFFVLFMAGCHDSGAPESKGSPALPASAAAPAPSAAPASAVAPASGVVSEAEEPRPLPRDFFKPKFEASDPAAPIEVAVLSGMGGKIFILPILSIPLHPEQFPDGQNHREGAMSMFAVSPLTALPAPDESAVQATPESEVQATSESEDQEIVRREELYVAQQNYMSSLPRSWVDFSGNHYAPNGAAARDDGVIGGALGFELKDAIPENKQGEARERLVLNRAEGFPARRSVPVTEWKRWPELSRELSGWSKRQLDACQDKAKCKKAIDALIAPARMEGVAYEYSISDGSKLRYVEGKSRAKTSVLEECQANCGSEKPADELQFHLWMYVNADGSVQALHLGEGFYTGLDSPVLVDHYCDSQCGAAWRGPPSVVSWNGQTFIVGSYTGGTLYGYQVYEVLPGRLRNVGRFAWGS